MRLTAEDREKGFKMKEVTDYCNLPVTYIRDITDRDVIPYTNVGLPGRRSKGPRRIKLGDLEDYCVEKNFDFFYPRAYFDSDEKYYESLPPRLRPAILD